MTKFIDGYLFAKQAISFAWNNKRLWWYQVVSMLMLPLFAYVISFIGKKVNVEQLSSSFAYGLKIVPLFIESFISILFVAALVNRFYALSSNKRMNFFQSFEFAHHVLLRLIAWGFVLALAVIFKSILGVKSGVAFNYDLVSGFPFAFNFFQFLIWSASWFIFWAWSLVVFFFVPVLIRKNKSFFLTLKESLFFLWKNLWVTIVAIIFYSLFFVLLFILLAAIVFFITWIVVLIFSIPFGSGWLIPFGVIFIVPLILVGLFFGTVSIVLPALIYAKR